MFLSAGGKNRRPPALASRPIMPRLQSAKRRKGSGGAVVCQKPITSRLVEMWDGGSGGGGTFSNAFIEIKRRLWISAGSIRAVSRTMSTRCTDWARQDRPVAGSGAFVSDTSLAAAISYLLSADQGHSGESTDLPVKVIGPLEFSSCLTNPTVLKFGNFEIT